MERLVASSLRGQSCAATRRFPARGVPMVTGERATRSARWRVTRGALLTANMILAACGLEGRLGWDDGAAGSDHALAGVFRIRAAHSDKCLAVAAGSTADRAQ